MKRGSTTTHQNQNNKQNNGILLIDYLEKGKTINSDYYCELLDRLKEEITKTASFVEKMHLFARQCTSSQIDKNDGKNQ